MLNRHRTTVSPIAARAVLLVFVTALSMVPACGAADATLSDAARAAWTSVGLCGGGGLFNPVISPHDPKAMMIESDMGGRYLSRDGGATWTTLHHRQIGSAVRGANPLFDPKRRGTIYALSGFGAATIHVTRDGAKTWAPLPARRQPRAGLIRCMYIDPARPQRLFVGTNAGKVVFTDDEGATWQSAKGITGSVIRIRADHAAGKGAGGRIVYVGTTAGVFRRDDEGKWYAATGAAGSVMRIGADHAAGNGAAGRIVFVGTTAGVFRSDDGGRTFARATTGLPAGKRLTGFACGSSAAGTVLYASVPCNLLGGKLAGGVYVSTDRGASWKRAMNPKIDVTTKQSSPWAGDLPQYSHLVANDADPKRAYVYCRGTSYFPPNHSAIYRTDDAGASWTSVWFVDPRFKECNVGRDWMTSFMHQSWVGRPIDMEISPTDTDTIVRADGMFAFITADGGKTWRPAHAVKAADTDDDAKLAWKHNGLVNTTTWHYYVDPHQPARHYIAYTDIGFARSLDGGRTWRWWGPGAHETEQRSAFPIPRQWINTTYELAFDPAVAGRMWGAFSGHHDIPNENSIWRGTGKTSHVGGIARSDDFGVTWTAQVKGLPARPALSVVLDPKSPKDRRTLYAGIYDNGVYKSTDGGATWVKKSKGLGHPSNLRICRVALHADGSLLALVTGMRVRANGPFTDKGVGLYRSTDAAETWTLVNKDYPLLYPRDFGTDPADSKVMFIGASDTPGAATKQGGLHRTTDGGKTWRRVLRKRNTHFGAYFHPKRPGWVYATCCGWCDAPEGSLFLSTDSGRTWKPFTGMPFAQINRVDFDPTNPDVIYVTTFGGSVWKGPAKPVK